MEIKNLKSITITNHNPMPNKKPFKTYSKDEYEQKKSNTMINMNIDIIRQHTDLYNLDKIRHLLSLKDSEWRNNFDDKHKKNTKETREYLKQYRNTLNRLLEDGETEVEREYTLRNNNRLYATGGIQLLEGNLRNFIVDEAIKDYDMINAQPSILLYLTKDAGLPYENLQYFCENREEILKKISNDRKKAKNTITCIFFQDKPKPTKNRVVDGMIDEYLSNRDILIHKHQNCLNENRDESPKNPKGSKMSNILCYWECVILNSVLCKFPTKSINTLMFDGFYSTLDIPIEQLNQMTEKFGIKWKVKPLETVYKLPEDFNKTKQRTYKEMKKDFEENNCLITFAGIFKSRNEIDGAWETQNLSQMNMRYKNWRTIDEEGNDCDFLDRWLKDKDREDYNRITFKPFSLDKYNNTHPKEFNVFRGFARKNLAREIKDHEVQWFLDFLKKAYGFEEESSDKFVKFLTRYYARIIQKPHEKIQGIMVLRGYEGTGKDTIKYIFGRLFGTEYVYECEGMNGVCPKENQWNEYLIDKIVCVMNEVAHEDAYKNIEALKHKATSVALNVKERYTNAQTLKDVNNMIVNSNNIFCVCISPTDRRYCVLITNEDLHGDDKFWEALYANIEDDDLMDILYTWLLQQDIEDFNFKQERPITEAFKKLANKTIHESYQVLYKLLSHHIKTNGNERWRMRTSYFNKACEYLVKHILEKNYDCKKSNVVKMMEEIPKKYLDKKKEKDNGLSAPTFWIVENPQELIDRFNRLEFQYHDGDNEKLEPLIEYVDILKE